MNINTSSKESSLQDFIRILFLHKIIIFFSFFGLMAIVFIGLQLRTPIYEAQVKILISAEKQVESPYYRDLSGYRKAEIALTQSEIVKSKPVIERAIIALELYKRPLDYEKNYCSPLKKKLIDYRIKKIRAKIKNLSHRKKKAFLIQKAIMELKQKISLELIRNTNLFIIKVTDFTPEKAATIANVVSRSYCIFDLQQQITELTLKYGRKHPTVKQLEDHINRLNSKLTSKPITDIEAIGPASVKIIEQAIPPLKSSGKSKALILTLAFIMSLLSGIGIALLLEYIDHNVKSPHDVEFHLNLPYIGSIPKKKFKDKALLKDAKSETLYTQFYENLCDKIFLLLKEKKLKSLLITSSLPQDGTSTIVANMGICFSQKLNQKTLLIDANFRNSHLHNIFATDKAPGLANILEGSSNVDKLIKNIYTDLSVIPAGSTTTNPIILLDKYRMSTSIKQIIEKYDVVIIDCPDLKNYKDSAVISSFVDGVVILMNEGKTRYPVILNSIKPLIQQKANILGVILNKRNFVIPKAIYKRL